MHSITVNLCQKPEVLLSLSEVRRQMFPAICYNPSQDQCNWQVKPHITDFFRLEETSQSKLQTTPNPTGPYESVHSTI